VLVWPQCILRCSKLRFSGFLKDYFRNQGLRQSKSKMAARILLLKKYYKLWTAAVAAWLATLVVAAFLVRQSFRLTALSDVIQCLLLFSGTISLIPQAVRARGRLRLFWTLMATGIGFWFSYQLLWTYFEVWLRTDVPDLCAGDMILFLHIVPLMAALALRPHAPQDEYAARLRRLDFALLMVWWGYLYVLIVIPWQYVVPDITPYDNNLNSLYLVEKVAFLSALFMAWLGSKGGWRVFYANLFGACFIYAAGSYVANWALSRHTYYSGSLYDIPLAVSMAWITLIGLWTRQREPQAGVRSTSTSHGVWLARLGMIAAFSLALFAAWALLDAAPPPRIRSFRLVLTLGAALLMGIMVFVRQRLLDGELLRLLTHSRESFANLKRLQVQITESEKLASIGQLVGGAAHELNNPITAMLGYSDLLLLSKPLTPEQSDLAARIGQHARRTKSLVASLLSFAKPSAAAIAPVDLNTLLRTAVKLSQPQWQALQIEVRTELPHELLLVRGDSNQLLQVCVQIINDALHAADQRKSRTLTITAQHKDGVAVINVSNATFAVKAEDTAFVSAETFSGLGLGACQGILRQHHGRILCLQDPNAGIAIRVELPIITPAPEKPTGVVVPVM
jgi:signal transduction histidine kinase